MFDTEAILYGVRQRCPSSPVVFNRLLESVVHSLLAAEGGYELAIKAYNNLVYADDVALMANSPERMTAL